MDQWIAPNYLLYFQIITTESTAVVRAEVNLKNTRIFRNRVRRAQSASSTVAHLFWKKKYIFSLIENYSIHAHFKR